MKKYRFYLLPLLAAVVAALAACSKEEYDDTDIWNKVNDLDRRVTNIENQLSNLNKDINDLSLIVQALQKNLYVINVEETSTGYTIVFSDNSRVSILSGHAGKDGLTPYVGDNGNWWIGTTDTGVLARGANGKDGRDGRDGKDGKDGLTPFIGDNGNWWIGTTDTGIPATTNIGGGGSGVAPYYIIKYYEGGYYWVQVLNGVETFMRDANGNLLPATGNGGVTPIIQINTTGYWIVSFDGGITFTTIVDEWGKPVKALGCTCEQYFKSVEVIGNQLVIILIDGTVITFDLVEGGGGGNYDPRLPNVVPEDIITHIDDYMPLYNGTNPPQIEGAYLIEPFTTVYCEDYNNGGFAPGVVVSSSVIRFSNQNATSNTIDFDQYDTNGNSTAKGTGAFISGSGNNFTAFFNTTGTSLGIATKTALIVSGTKTSQGIQNLYYAFVMVDKGSDPNNRLMNVGVYRIFNDGDGLSVNTQWNPSYSKGFSFEEEPIEVPYNTTSSVLHSGK